MRSSRYTLCIGSNTMTEVDFTTACMDVCSVLTNARCSHIYQTPDALLRPDTPPYLNMVVIGDSTCDDNTLRSQFRQLEQRYGRRRESEKNRVPLDIDIVVKDNVVLKEADFTAHHFKVGYQALQ